MHIAIPSIEDLNRLVEEVSLEEFAEESMNEAKTWDKPHGAKLPHAIITDFFQNMAPKYDTLDQVETALVSLYKKNNIEYTPQGIKQVVSNYRKKVDIASKKVQESRLDEEELTAEQKRKKERIVKSLKKKYKEFVKKYGNDAKSVMYATATSMAKGD